MQPAVMKSRQPSRTPVPVRRQGRRNALNGQKNPLIISNTVARAAEGVYTSVPIAMTRNFAASYPRMRNSIRNGRAVTTVRHREFIADIFGSIPFKTTTIALNPGLSSMLPWLSVVANNWESYTFRKLKFMIQTTAPTTTQGSVLVAIDFDAADPPPTSKQQMMTYHNAVRTAPWSNVDYDATTKDIHKFSSDRYTRSGGLSPNLDIKTYDVGNLIVATVGQLDGAQVCEVYCEYEVEFHTPHTNTTTTVADANSARIRSTTPTVAAQFTGAVVTGGLGVGAAGNTLTFAMPGSFLITNLYIGTGMTVAAQSYTAVGATATSLYNTSPGIGTSYISQLLLNVVASGATLTYGAMPATTVSSVDTRIASYDTTLG